MIVVLQSWNLFHCRDMLNMIPFLQRVEHDNFIDHKLGMSSFFLTQVEHIIPFKNQHSLRWWVDQLTLRNGATRTASWVADLEYSGLAVTQVQSTVPWLPAMVDEHWLSVLRDGSHRRVIRMNDDGATPAKTCLFSIGRQLHHCRTTNDET